MADFDYDYDYEEQYGGAEGEPGMFTKTREKIASTAKKGAEKLGRLFTSSNEPAEADTPEEAATPTPAEAAAKAEAEKKAKSAKAAKYPNIILKGDSSNNPEEQNNIPGFSIKVDDKSTFVLDKVLEDLSKYNNSTDMSATYINSVQDLTGSTNHYGSLFADIDINIKRAMVESVIGETDGYINKDMNIIYNEGINNINTLIYQIKPKLELLKMLEEQKKKITIMKTDPDIQRCVYKLNATIEYIMRDMNPELVQLLNYLENKPDTKDEVGINEFDVPFAGLGKKLRKKSVAPNLSQIQLGSMHVGGGRKKYKHPIGF